MNLAKELNYFKKELKRNANSKRALGAKRYLKSPWRFYGVNNPTIRKIVKNWLNNYPEISMYEIMKVVEKLWDSQWHEEKTAAVMLLQHRSTQLSTKHLLFIEKMLHQATGWDHLDEISIRLVGSLIDKEPDILEQLPKWAVSNNFWVRRASLLSQISQFRKKTGNKKLFFRLAIPMFKEGNHWSKEEKFFIRKAIGWTLREIAQKEPLQAYKFIRKYKSKMSGLTLREGARKLPKKFKKLIYE